MLEEENTLERKVHTGVESQRTTELKFRRQEETLAAEPFVSSLRLYQI